ncbi:hypothetical protein DIPPA_31252 [Diplonema papillatum]|nr:hypothetical protein DIPPA_31252 [Diplonema papillatum]
MHLQHIQGPPGGIPQNVVVRRCWELEEEVAYLTRELELAREEERRCLEADRHAKKETSVRKSSTSPAQYAYLLMPPSSRHPFTVAEPIVLSADAGASRRSNTDELHPVHLLHYEPHTSKTNAETWPPAEEVQAGCGNLQGRRDSAMRNSGGERRTGTSLQDADDQRQVDVAGLQKQLRRLSQQVDVLHRENTNLTVAYRAAAHHAQQLKRRIDVGETDRRSWPSRSPTGEAPSPTSTLPQYTIAYHNQNSPPPPPPPPSLSNHGSSPERQRTPPFAHCAPEAQPWQREVDLITDKHQFMLRALTQSESNLSRKLDPVRPHRLP